MNVSPHDDKKPLKKRYLRAIDIFVLVVFTSTAVWGLYLFRTDLMRTLEIRDAEPAGFVVVRDNIVQRRHDDRVLWDRLFADSAVFSGDLIRAADLSSALLFVSENEIYLGENTLIRIQYDPAGKGQLRVELREGRINIAGTQDNTEQDVFLEYMGQQIQAGKGSVLDAEIIDEGIAVQVNEGTATYVSNGVVCEITQGEVIAMNSDGSEISVSPERIRFSPLRFFRAENLIAIADSARSSVSGFVRDIMRTSESDVLQISASDINVSVEIPPAQPVIEPEPVIIPGRTTQYTVISGDTLSKIAGKVYGDATQWRRIFEANNIANQDLIFPGQVFVIP